MVISPLRRREKTEFFLVLWAALGILLSLTAAAPAVVFTTSDGPVAVRNWGYRLQGSSGEGGYLLPGPLAAAPHEMLVIDFSRDGSEDQKFTPQEIRDIQHSAPALGGDGHRKLLAGYIAIGEASNFRSYWNPAWTDQGESDPDRPSWLGPVNPDWPESRKVRYWESGWQSIVYDWLDQIVAQGFDAAYLDIVDAYYFWGAEYAGSGVDDPDNERDAAERMIDFVVAMGEHARQTNPDFLLIPQNASYILNALEDEDPIRKQAYLDAIAASANEDLYFQGNLDENNPLNPERDATRGILTADFLDNGVPVFVVDYLTDPAKIDALIDMAEGDRFYPYAAPSRGLDVLGNPISVPEPSLASQITLLLAILGAAGMRRSMGSARPAR